MRVPNFFIFRPTLRARDALGAGAAAPAAFREVALAARGFDIAHIQYAFADLTLTASSRVRPDGYIEIEADVGNPAMPRSVFTAAELKAAEQAARKRPERK